MRDLRCGEREYQRPPAGDAPSAGARVLVAVMNDPRDLQIAREQGWYRIPLAHAPAQVGADYLAFYQTKAFGEERWAVNYYAAVKRFRIAARHDLLPQEPDHPRAGDLYYRIEIGPLERLPRPIPSYRLRRLTFIPTTLHRLLHAEEINDLWCSGAAEERLWRAFKENGIIVERCYPLRDDDDSQQLTFAIFCDQGRLAVICEPHREHGQPMVHEQTEISDYEFAACGWTLLRFSGRELTRSLSNCLAVADSAIARHGGLLPAKE